MLSRQGMRKKRHSNLQVKFLSVAGYPFLQKMQRTHSPPKHFFSKHNKETDLILNTELFIQRVRTLQKQLQSTP